MSFPYRERHFSQYNIQNIFKNRNISLTHKPTLTLKTNFAQLRSQPCKNKISNTIYNIFYNK